MADNIGNKNPYPFWIISFLRVFNFFPFLHKYFIALLYGSIFLNNVLLLFRSSLETYLKEIALCTHSHKNLIADSSKQEMIETKFSFDIRFFVKNFKSGK